MAGRRVVITGLGAITPLGNDVETFWSNLKNGVSGICTIDAFDTSAYACKIGGQVNDFDPKPFFKNPKDVRRTDRFTQLAMAASKMAVHDSGIDVDNLERRDRFGVIVSTGIGGLKTLHYDGSKTHPVNLGFRSRNRKTNRPSIHVALA